MKHHLALAASPLATACGGGGNAAATNTPAPVPVLANGRALSVEQLADLRGTHGVEPVPGRYGHDAQSGLYGDEGAPPTGFLACAQARLGAGGGGIWSTRFSAGNASADNAQGYVSVPGHEPVGYGF